MDMPMSATGLPPANGLKPAGLAFQCHGDRRQPALMLLHGFLSSSAQWLPNIAHLAQDYHVVTVELWGHGDSPEPSDKQHYSIAGYINGFELIRQQLQIPHWGLVGQSYGAGLVLNYAARCRQQCSSVLVTNSRSAFGKIAPPRAADASAPPKPPRELPFHPIHARRFPEHIKAALVASADRMTASCIADSGDLAHQLAFSHRLHELTQPLLLANGKFEKSFQTDLQQLLALYPQLDVVNLDGGHSVNIEAAEAFNQAAKAFFDQHQRAAQPE